MSSAAPLPIPEGSTGRRRHARFRVEVPFDVTVCRPGSVVRFSGRAQDIGEGGLCGVVSGSALPGERAELTVVLPTSAEPLSMRAVVRYELGLHCGFEFLSLEQSQREELQRMGADPDVRAGLINETEWEPGLAPSPRPDLALCATCGNELPEEIPVCLICGTPAVQEGAEDSEAPVAAAKPGLVPLAAAPAKRDATKKRRGPVLDSVIAIVFLVTLTIGLWQWLQSPADADAQPSPVTIELENVFLRPVPPSVEQASSTARSRSGAVLSAASSVVSAVIGSASRRSREEAVGTPGSAATEAVSRVEPPPVSNSSSNSNSNPSSNAPQYRSAPAASVPSQLSPAPAAAAPSEPSTASKLIEKARKAAETSNASTTPASEAPSGTDLAGMLLQKVLPLYPAEARRQGVQGQVVLKAVIGKDGTITALQPLQGPQALTAAAIDAVQHWRFRPYELKGQPVEVETDIRLNFQLPNKK